MLNLKLTKGAVNGATTLSDIFDNWESVKDAFYPTAIPEFQRINQRYFINTEATLIDNSGTSTHVRFLLMDKKGNLFNERSYGYLELPAEGYLARYTSKSNIHQRKTHYSEITSDVFAICTYIIDIKNIHLIEVRNGAEYMYQPEQMDLTGIILPEVINQFNRGDTEPLYKKYIAE